MYYLQIYPTKYIVNQYYAPQLQYSLLFLACLTLIKYSSQQQSQVPTSSLYKPASVSKYIYIIYYNQQYIIKILVGQELVYIFYLPFAISSAPKALINITKVLIQVYTILNYTLNIRHIYPNAKYTYRNQNIDIRALFLELSKNTILIIPRYNS